MKKIVASAAALLVLTFAVSSFADETKKPAPAVVRGEGYDTSDNTGASYSVEFVDDALQAQGANGGIPLITVRPPVGRATLIRPRLQFVAELMKSIENI
jgi:hypothetical protein